MRDVIAMVAALCICMAGFGIAAVLDAQAETARMIPRVGATLDRACIQFCPDCPPFCERAPGAVMTGVPVPYYAPKP